MGILFLVFVLTLVSGAFLTSAFRLDKAEKFANRLRDAVQGIGDVRVVPGGAFRRAYLRCAGAGWEGEVRFFPEGLTHRDLTRAAARFADPRGRVRITRQGIGDRIARFFGAQDVQVGAPDFDDRYVVKSEPPSAAPAILDEATRKRIDSVFAFADAARLQLAGRDLTVSVPKLLTAPDPLRRFVGDFLAIAGRIAEQVPGLEIVEQAQTVGACQVCGQPMETEIVRCRKCSTAHHRECWAYLGACSTFACGESRHQ